MNDRSLTLSSLSLLLTLGALGCSGGSDPPESTEQQDTKHCTADLVGAVDPTLLIDDLEDNDTRLAEVSGRNGNWWLATDGTGGTTTPPGDQEAPPERILGGRCGSK